MKNSTTIYNIYWRQNTCHSLIPLSLSRNTIYCGLRNAMPWNLTLGLQQNTIQGRPSSYCLITRQKNYLSFTSKIYTSHDMTIDHSSSRWRVEFQMLPSFLHVATSSICWLHWWFRCLAPMMNLEPLMVKWDSKPTQTNQHITKLLLVDITIYQPVYKPYIENI